MVGPNEAGEAGGGTVNLPYAHLSDLQEREHQLAVTQRLVHVGGWAWDLATDTMDWSDELFRIFGLEPSALVPTMETFFTAVDASHRDRCRTFVAGLLTTGIALSFDCPLRRPDDTVRWIRAECRLERDQAGKPVRMYGTAQDITDFFGTDHAASGGVAEMGRTFGGPAQWVGQALTADSVTFFARAAAALTRASRYGWSTAMLFVETTGRTQPPDGKDWAGAAAVGEEITRRILSVLRPYDALVPLFGPVHPGALDTWTFTILCENVSSEFAATVAGRIATLFHGGLTTDDLTAPISAEVGFAVAAPGDTDLESLRARACAAPGDRHAEPADPEPYVNAAALELQQGFDAGQLRLHYQPKIALDRDCIVAVEALLRWQHPERGLVPPLEFIPLAEQTGLIIPIGAWILDEACAQATRWHRRYPRRTSLAVSVNLSARQFGADLVGVVQRALVRNDTDPAWLCLEITEGLIMANLDEAMDILVQLSELGIALSIDDFGTGFSSLARLKQFPVNEVKIDKAFIDGLGIEADDTAIVAAIVSMAHAMHLTVVAEGVETAEQLERLRVLGCDEVQGYLLGFPGPPHSVELLLADELRPGWRSHAGRPHPTADADRAGYRPERVLVVDDTADVRELAVISLTAAGYDAHSASNGAVGLAEAARLRPDCVVLDVLLPDISGLEVCRALRADPVTSDCTIVMLSSVADGDGKAAAFSGGADDYIVKPFSPRDLASRVRAAMRRRRADADAVSADGSEIPAPVLVPETPR